MRSLEIPVDRLDAYWSLPSLDVSGSFHVATSAGEPSDDELLR